MSAAPVDELPWPPGFAGQLANFIYHSAHRPVREVAIAATLGLLAAVAGRRYTISGTGLNLYIILVGRSGVGKETMHSGITSLIQQGAEGIQGTDRFVDFNDMASGQALHKAILHTPCFVNVVGEFGRKLMRMANERDAPMQSLRTVITTAYSKSGPGDYLGGLTYSKAEEQLKGVMGPAFSLVGETTPDTLYQALTSSMMADGFLSRFTIVEYTGDRPAPNEARAVELEEDELRRWRAMLAYCVQSTQAVNPGPRVNVGYQHEDAEDKLKRFGLECDAALNATEEESRRQMWNRAHLKALRIAAVLAATDVNYAPKINLGHATWAITLVRRDIAAMNFRLDNGEVGNDDHTRISLVLTALRDYFLKNYAGSYNVVEGMQAKFIVTYTFIQTRMQRKSAFKDHPLGLVKALDITLQAMSDSGYIEKVADRQLDDFTYRGRCFYVRAGAFKTTK